jgi:hypothetical protein
VGKCFFLVSHQSNKDESGASSDVVIYIRTRLTTAKVIHFFVKNVLE